eukprot:TRINITY_DN5432_c0_g1_i9.p1 TRINITY_DN5432_c0_g1~~TRINITY_DN5432_c0_g1_i9.p1  ORF type:complete len:523 (+),score=76.11 TRINITY_DN5432_c0_g1_i9:624-2192(+)
MIPVTRPLFFQQPGGERFIHFIWVVSCYALECNLKKIRGKTKTTDIHWIPQIPPLVQPEDRRPTYYAAMNKVMLGHVIQQRQSFVRYVRDAKERKSSWNKWAESKIAEYHDLLQEMARQRQEQLRFDTDVDRSIFEDSQSIQRQKYLEKIRGFYKAIEAFHASTLATRGLVDDILRGRPNTNRLERDMIAYSVPTTLLDYTKDVDIEPEDLYKSSVANLLRLWKVFLRLMHRLIMEMETGGNVQKIISLSDALLSSSESCTQYYESQKRLIGDLNEDIKRLHHSIQELTNNVDRLSKQSAWNDQTTFISRHDGVTGFSTTNRSSSTPGRNLQSFGLVPPTPHFSLVGLGENTGSAREKVPQFDQADYRYPDPTPDAVQKLMRSVHRRAGRAQGDYTANLDLDELQQEANSRRQLDFSIRSDQETNVGDGSFLVSPSRDYQPVHSSPQALEKKLQNPRGQEGPFDEAEYMPDYDDCRRTEEGAQSSRFGSIVDQVSSMMLGANHNAPLFSVSNILSSLDSEYH